MKNSKTLLLLLFSLLLCNAAFSQKSFKTIVINDVEIKCQRTTEEERVKMGNYMHTRKSLANLENYLEDIYQQIERNHFLIEEPTSDIEKEINAIKSAKADLNFISTKHYTNEYKAYVQYYQNQLKNPDYPLLLAKAEIKEGHFNNGIKHIDELILKNPENTELIEMKADAYFKYGLDLLNRGKSLFEKNSYDEEYLYRSLEQFANAYEMDYDKNKIMDYVDEINEIGVSYDSYVFRRVFKPFDEENLYKISTASQKINNEKIDSLRTIIKSNKENKDVLLDTYEKLVVLAEYEFRDGKYQIYEYASSVAKKAKLQIQYGDRCRGCEELYEASLTPVNGVSYSLSSCEGCYIEKLEMEKDEYKKIEKEKALQWYADNPNVIKLRSLLGKGSFTVAAYLGEPIDENYKMDTGGRNSSQFIGKVYKTTEGKYEVGYKNGNVNSIRFYPSKTIKYDPEVFRQKETGFDLVGGMTGACSGTTSEGHVGNTKSFSINFDCSNYKSASTTFYGRDGKVTSVYAR